MNEVVAKGAEKTCKGRSARPEMAAHYQYPSTSGSYITDICTIKYSAPLSTDVLPLIVYVMLGI